MTPLNATVEALVRRLEEGDREAFEERAGIMQFEAGNARELAECLALLEVIRMKPLAVSGVIVLDTQIKGKQATVLTTDQSKTTELGNRRIDLAAAVRGMDSVAVLKPLS